MINTLSRKTPDIIIRWQRVIQCEIRERPGRTPFKDVLLDICDQRNDDLVRLVEIRIKGAHTDLPTADAQYHERCYDEFVAISMYTSLSSDSDVITDNALRSIITSMCANQYVRT